MDITMENQPFLDGYINYFYGNLQQLCEFTRGVINYSTFDSLWMYLEGLAAVYILYRNHTQPESLKLDLNLFKSFISQWYSRNCSDWPQKSGFPQWHELKHQTSIRLKALMILFYTISAGSCGSSGWFSPQDIAKYVLWPSPTDRWSCTAQNLWGAKGSYMFLRCFYSQKTQHILYLVVDIPRCHWFKLHFNTGHLPKFQSSVA